ncbi:MAG: hypothetical protein GF311_13435 [Candidatus Lokiarchaeota archaeon]|nr:hypothetical protein [Candidatus Lokiarchaeota archaeon]
MDDNKVLTSAYIMVILGGFHLILGIMALGLLELSVTAFIFFGFYIPMGLGLINLIKNNLLDETRSLLLGCTTISFLNSLTYFLLIITRAPEERTYLYLFLIIQIIFNIINFPILFKKKIGLDDMVFDEKLSYFSIVVIRGLGFNFTFNILAWIGWPMEPVYPMIIYLLIFGILNLMLSGLLYNKSREKNLQLSAILILLTGMIIGIGLFYFYPSPKIIICTILYLIIIPIRIYYFNNNFKSE